MNFLTVLYKLLIAHALCDYVLQPESMGKHKHPSPGSDPVYGPWWWSMMAHALVNGGGVYVATGVMWIGVLETIVHFVLDTEKCLGMITTQEDQFGHIASKIVWAICGTIVS